LLGDGQTSNTQPTWAPAGDLAWIAFNSMREYGVVTPKGTQQIWVAAVDLASGAADPSFPAFRLQFQGLDENNHRPYCATGLRELPRAPDAGVATPADGGMCAAPLEMCDPLGAGCCDPAYLCDSNDDGATYFCFKHIG